VVWADLETHRCGVPRRLAYLGHHSGMSDTLTGLENLRFALTLAEVPWDTGLVQQVLQQLALQDVVSRPLGRLSQGQRRRLALARVWLSQRPLWLLDEPDNSLDGEGSQCLAQMLEQHLEAGGLAVVVSTAAWRCRRSTPDPLRLRQQSVPRLWCRRQCHASRGLGRELRLAARRPADALGGLLFFVLVGSLFRWRWGRTPTCCSRLRLV
jgi:ABC-type transport system involved in cytochrome c biogenesis ATPase subunit